MKKTNKMKKNTILITSLVLLMCVSLVGVNQYTEKNSLKNVETFGSFVEYDYNQLKDASSVIALVKIEDDLTKDNSTIEYMEETNFIRGYYGTRKAKVIKYYKNEKNLGKNISFIEPAAVTENNEYIHTHDYERLENNNQYIVFLSDATASGKLSVISANNGRIDVDNLQNNKYPNITIKSILEFETPSSNISQKEKLGVLNSSVAYDIANSHNKNQKIINTNFGPLNVEYFYDQAEENEYIKVNDTSFVVKGKYFTK